MRLAITAIVNTVVHILDMAQGCGKNHFNSTAVIRKPKISMHFVINHKLHYHTNQIPLTEAPTSIKHTGSHASIACLSVLLYQSLLTGLLAPATSLRLIVNHVQLGSIRTWAAPFSPGVDL